MLKICGILLCIENEQRPYINRTHDETYLSRSVYVFTTVSTSLVKQYSELGLRRPEPIYMRVG